MRTSLLFPPSLTGSHSLLPPSRPFSTSPGCPGFPPWLRDDTRGLPNSSDSPQEPKRGQLLLVGQRILSIHSHCAASTLSTGLPATKGIFLEWTVPGNLTGNCKKNLYKIVNNPWKKDDRRGSAVCLPPSFRDTKGPYSALVFSAETWSRYRSYSEPEIIEKCIDYGFCHQQQCLTGMKSPHTVPVRCRLVWRYYIFLCSYVLITSITKIKNLLIWCQLLVRECTGIWRWYVHCGLTTLWFWMGDWVWSCWLEVEEDPSEWENFNCWFGWEGFRFSGVYQLCFELRSIHFLHLPDQQLLHLLLFKLFPFSATFAYVIVNTESFLSTLVHATILPSPWLYIFQLALDSHRPPEFLLDPTVQINLPKKNDTFQELQGITETRDLSKSVSFQKSDCWHGKRKTVPLNQSPWKEKNCKDFLVSTFQELKGFLRFKNSKDHFVWVTERTYLFIAGRTCPSNFSYL